MFFSFHRSSQHSRLQNFTGEPGDDGHDAQTQETRGGSTGPTGRPSTPRRARPWRWPHRRHCRAVGRRGPRSVGERATGRRGPRAIRRNAWHVMVFCTSTGLRPRTPGSAPRARRSRPPQQRRQRCGRRFATAAAAATPPSDRRQAKYVEALPRLRRRRRHGDLTSVHSCATPCARSPSTPTGRRGRRRQEHAAQIHVKHPRSDPDPIHNRPKYNDARADDEQPTVRPAGQQEPQRFGADRVAEQNAEYGEAGQDGRGGARAGDPAST